VIYCFDTSGWIQAWNDLYPQDTFPSLWEKMDALIREGRIIAPEEVLVELKRKDDGVHLWAKERAEMFVKLDGSFLERGIEITNRYKRMLDQKPGKHGADPSVVALALDRRATVVTPRSAPTGTSTHREPGRVPRREGPLRGRSPVHQEREVEVVRP
jgi:hypothetical protein